jgi:hypothetical protein
MDTKTTEIIKEHRRKETEEIKRRCVVDSYTTINKLVKRLFEK